MLGKLKKGYTTIGHYYKEAADKAELVYFGRVYNDDETHRPKGITFSSHSKDNHVCHGTINDYDVSLFNRHATHQGQNRAKTTDDWTMVVVKLKLGGFPNLIIDSRKHDKQFYHSIFTRFPHLRRGGELLAQINPSAAQYFDLFIAPQSAVSTLNMLDDSMLQRMITQYGKYDVQIEDNTLTVFARGKASSTRQLTDMLNEAVWIAERIEYKSAYAQQAEQPALVGAV